MYKVIKYEDLIFWGENPRYGLNVNHDTPEKAIRALFELDQTKMTRLAKDIAEFGLIPSDLPIVRPTSDNKFIVYEGNRRVASIYSLHNPEYLNFKESLKKTFADIEILVPSDSIMCYVDDDISKIYNYTKRIHNGEQGGIGRVSWGTTENNIIKELEAKSNATILSDSKTEYDPHYQLLNDYPNQFKTLVEKIKPTNIDRILKKNIFKEAVGTTDYSNIKPKQAKAISSTLVYAHEQSINHKGGLSRMYNDPEIESELVPYYKQIIDGMTTEKHNDTVIKLSATNTKINEGERVELSSFILNQEDFEAITYTSSNLSIDENGNVLSTNKAGKYNIVIRAYIDEAEHDSTIFDINIVKKREVIAKASDKLFSHDFAANYIINISDPVNSFINQANKLNLTTYSYVANVCLRIVLEQSLDIFVKNKKLTTKTNYPSDLEKYLNLFKNYYVNSKITILDNKSNLGYKKVYNLINKLSPEDFSKELHPLAHNIKTIKKSEIQNLANRVANLLIIISEELK